MSFYQACYTRLGRQERNAGWNVLAATEGMSRTALEHFKSIASDVVRQKKLSGVIPSEIFFIRADERFIYLCNMVLDCADDDGRGNSFIHGYIIVRSEYYRKCFFPSSILGIEDFEFIKNANELSDAQMKGLPQKKLISHEQWNRQDLIQKYEIGAVYDELMMCVLSVLERKEASLCIRMKNGQLEDLKKSSKEILFCIMEGLPQMLRTQITASSFDIGRSKLFFSVQIPKGNQEYFDLSTGEYSCPFVCRKWYMFLKGAMCDTRGNPIWEKTIIFFDTVFGWNGCAGVSHRLIEAVYSYYGSGRPENVSESLASFINAGPAICTMTYDFLRYMMPWIDAEELEGDLIAKLCYLDKINEDDEFRNVFMEWMGELEDNPAEKTDMPVVVENDESIPKKLKGLYRSIKERYYQLNKCKKK